MLKMVFNFNICKIAHLLHHNNKYHYNQNNLLKVYSIVYFSSVSIIEEKMIKNNFIKIQLKSMINKYI